MAFDLAQFRLDGRVALVVGAAAASGSASRRRCTAPARRWRSRPARPRTWQEAAERAARGRPGGARLSRSTCATRATCRRWSRDVHARLRPPRHPRQLRRAERAQAGRRDHAGRLGRRLRRQHPRDVLRLPGRGARDARAGRRAHPQHRLGRRPAGRRQRHAVRRLARRASASSRARSRPSGRATASASTASRRAACARTRRRPCSPIRCATPRSSASIPLGRSSVPDDIAGYAAAAGVRRRRVHHGPDAVGGRRLEPRTGGGMMATQPQHRALLMDRQRHLTLVEQPRPAVAPPGRRAGARARGRGLRLGPARLHRPHRAAASRRW